MTKQNVVADRVTRLVLRLLQVELSPQARRLVRLALRKGIEDGALLRR